MADDSGYGLNQMPAIRNNPEVAIASQQRRNSVANPNPVQMPDPDDSLSNHTSDSDEDSSDDDDSSMSDMDNNSLPHPDSPTPKTNDKNNNNKNDNNDNNMQNTNNQHSSQNSHSISPAIGTTNFNNMHIEHQNVPTHNSGNNLISSLGKIYNQGSLMPRNNNNNYNDPAHNPYSPANILSRSTLRRNIHRRGDSNSSHTRSYTTAPFGLNTSNLLLEKPPQSHRRTRSQSNQRGQNKLDYTFVCTRIEGRKVLKKYLKTSEYSLLMSTFKNVIRDTFQKYGGTIVVDTIDDREIGHYDNMIVYNNVHSAVESAVAIQVGLNETGWPAWFNQFEKNSTELAYTGTGPNHAFNGLRVCIGLHTAREGTKINPYDNGVETVTRRLESVGALLDWDVEYTGTAVELAQHLCGIAYGGEILASKAVHEAFNRDRTKNQRAADKLFIQQLGSHHFENLRKVDLVQFTPQALHARQFPQRSFYSTEEEAKQGSAINQAMSGLGFPTMPLEEYDPFPKGSSDEDVNESDNDTIQNNDDNRDNADSDHSSDNEPTRHYHISDPSQRHLDLEELDKFSGDDEKSAIAIPKPPESKRSKLKHMESRRESGAFLPRNTGSRNEQKRRMRLGTNSINVDRGDHSSESDNENSPSKISAPPASHRSKKIELERAKSTLRMSGTTTPISETSSKRTGSSLRNKFLQVANPKQTLQYHEARPIDLPSAYGQDSEFLCLACNSEKKWTTGVWRCPMWPSFDVCSQCANETLSMNHQTFRKVPRHVTMRSDAALITNQPRPDADEEINQQMSNEKLIHALRKELSSIIEELTEQKLKRLKNMQDWAETPKKSDKQFKKFSIKAINDFTETEKELAEWRKVQNNQDIQEQKLRRRQSALNHLESPTVSDIESDEELIANFQDYDPDEDFRMINRRLTELNNIFWEEIEIVKEKLIKANNENKKTFATLENEINSNLTPSKNNNNNNIFTNNLDSNDVKQEETDIVDASVSNMRSDLSSEEELLQSQHQHSDEVDTYISQINRKDEELFKKQQEIKELQATIGELQHQQDEDDKYVQEKEDENDNLQEQIKKLRQSMYNEDDPVEQSTEELVQLRDEITQIKSRMNTLQIQLNKAEEENERLALSKIDVIKGTSHQIETLRDEICNLNDKLQIQTLRVHELTKLNHRYENRDDEKMDEFHETEGATASTTYLAKASTFFSIGRSRFSTPLWKETVNDTKESKIRLAQETSKEIERLREIIRVLSKVTIGKNGHLTRQSQPGVFNKNNNNSPTSNMDHSRQSTHSSLNEPIASGARHYAAYSAQNNNSQNIIHENKEDDNYDDSLNNPWNNDNAPAPPGVIRMGTSVVWDNKHNPDQGSLSGVPLYA